ncbi:MAG: hypothetical protein M0P47_06705 [Bacteroidales bacterium]|nr:hypothetical protein [Bacteroidales bacterium]
MKNLVKEILLFCFFCFVCSSVSGQLSLSDTATDNASKKSPYKHLDYRFTIGSQAIFSPGLGSAFTSFITPQFSYGLNPKLRIGGGINISTTYFPSISSMYPNENKKINDLNYITATIFINGSYLVNDRLTLYGSAFKMFPITNSTSTLPYNPYFPVFGNGAEGVSFQADYKIGRHMFIQAGFNYSNGYSPFDDRFGSINPGFYSPHW